MRNRAVRVTLFGVFLVAVGAAAYLFWTGESKMRVDTDAARAFDGYAQETARAVTDLRLAQQGYVAAGQGHQFWASKADVAADAAREGLSQLRTGAASADAQTDIDSASATLQDLLQMDRRAREYARSSQKLLASDLVFSDGLEMTRAALASIEHARLAETNQRAAAARTVHRRQLYALGSAAAAATLIVLLLVPGGTARVDAAPTVARPLANTGEASAEDLDLAAALDNSEGWSTPRPVKPPVPAVDLSGVATLCTELARVGETRALPAALERAASVLDAAGIVLWIADPDGRELAPIVAHGYPAQVLTRLGTIARDAENATAAAFRTSLLQTVKADAVSHGAIAAPLLTPTGCVGVMAAEMRNAGEQQADRLAAATIVAAQLATLAAPPSSRPRNAEAAGA